MEPYLSGANVSDPHQFMGFRGAALDWSFRNYYINKYFSEARLFNGTSVASIVLIVLMFFMETL